MTKQLSTNNKAIVQSGFETLLQENLDVALGALSDKNRLEYERTFEYWKSFAAKQGLEKWDFQLCAVKTFITDNEWSFNTQKTRLAHLKKFAQILAMADSDGSLGYAFNYGRLSLLKPKNLTGQKFVKKHQHLSQKQVYSVFDAWQGDSNKEVRNRAILGVMLFAGLRAFEVAKLQWSDIDFENKVLYVRDGKGEKSAFVPMLGSLPKLLTDWHSHCPDNRYVAVGINKGDSIIADKLVSTQTITNIILATNKETGIDFSPHDTRRTLINDLLNKGINPKDVQTLARHANAETTLGYAEAKGAKDLGVILDGKLSYGELE